MIQEPGSESDESNGRSLRTLMQKDNSQSPLNVQIKHRHDSRSFLNADLNVTAKDEEQSRKSTVFEIAPATLNQGGK